MFITSVHHAAQHGRVEQLVGLERHELVGPRAGGASDVTVSLDLVHEMAEPPPGPPSNAAGSVSVVLEGALRHEGSTLPRGSVLLGGRGDGTPTNGAPTATVLTITSGPGLQDAGSVTSFSLDEIADAAAHNPALGFFDMSARMLVDGPSAATRSFTLGLGTFAPASGCHALHRHANAAEFFYVWEGSGAHLTEDGVSHPLEAGDLVYVPRNEWHGFRNTGAVPARAFFGYLGVGSRSDAGYEVR